MFANCTGRVVTLQWKLLHMYISHDKHQYVNQALIKINKFNVKTAGKISGLGDDVITTILSAVAVIV